MKCSARCVSQFGGLSSPQEWESPLGKFWENGECKRKSEFISWKPLRFPSKTMYSHFCILLVFREQFLFENGTFSLFCSFFFEWHIWEGHIMTAVIRLKGISFLNNTLLCNNYQVDRLSQGPRCQYTYSDHDTTGFISSFLYINRIRMSVCLRTCPYSSWTERDINMQFFAKSSLTLPECIFINGGIADVIMTS